MATTLLTATTYYLVTASQAPCPNVQDTVHITVGDSLYVYPSILPAFDHNKYYEQQLQTNAGYPYYYSIASGELPTGMILHADGLLSGTPSFDGQLHTFVVQKIFEDDDGWDGTCKGKDAPIDTYFYILFYLNPEGGESKQTGSITIVR